MDGILQERGAPPAGNGNWISPLWAGMALGSLADARRAARAASAMGPAGGVRRRPIRRELAPERDLADGVPALAMCAGMAAADLAAPALPGSPTPWLTFLMMTLGMAGGSLAARGLAGASRRPARRDHDALNRGRRWD